MNKLYTNYLSALFVMSLCFSLNAQNNVTFQVDMSQETVAAEGVSVSWAGPGATGLGDVSIVALDDADGDGVYSVTTEVMEDSIGYFFINGASSNPLNFEMVPEDCGFGLMFMGLSFNVRPLEVTGDINLPVVCWAACEACPVVDCDDPAVLIDDDASSYDLGDLGESAPWGIWPGFGGAVGMVVDTFESDNVFRLQTGIGQDVALYLGNNTSGHYRLAFLAYIPDTSTAFVDVSLAEPGPDVNYGARIRFDGGGVGDVTTNSANDDIAFSYPENDWFKVVLYVDLDNDIARLQVDGTTVGLWTEWSEGSEGPLLQFAGVNFYEISPTDNYFIDNVEFWEIPAADVGQYCYTATTISEGTHTVPGTNCYGGGYQIDSGDDGEGGYWYIYTPAEDGILSISSCNGGVDTRGWIFQGDDCGSLDIVGVNDDQCPIEVDGSEWASYREAIVTGGTQYYIMWDNVWEADGFDWELTLNTTDPPVEGDYCQTAQVITPGEYAIDEFTGNAAVTGPTIGNTSQGRTPTSYTLTEWYSYTPTEEGTMTITSCDGSASDNRVWVYTGECSTFSGLTLVATDDDGCGVSGGPSLVEAYEVTPGTTYLIEWDNGWDSDAFLWELIFTPVVDVDEAALNEGFNVFPNPVSDLLQVDIELPEVVDQLSLRLQNNLGQLVEQRLLTDVLQQRVELNVSQLPAGVYFLELTNGSQAVTRKVVIE